MTKPLQQATSRRKVAKHLILAGVRMNIRIESPGDFIGIRSVELEAFPTSAEADLVDLLRTNGEAVFSLVAEDGERIVGHAMFSRMRNPPGTLGLGPVAVLTAYRRRHIADAMVREGIRLASGAGWKAIFVLGDQYYRRFGFDPSLTAGCQSRYAGPHLMALALKPEALPFGGGPLQYASAFDCLGC